ncbi:methyltransferase, FxLD system [Actinomadura nitritigenes]|uniref:methyltransferase, FxLD system n=1 Tax=Actinomadura nitritigenes TaxID=134602 RepID=UPI003D938729
MVPSDWPQYIIDFADWRQAEEIAATALRPALVDAERAGAIRRWFFVRKAPHWRLRCQAGANDARHHLADVLDDLKSDGRLIGWAVGIYEPETRAFGGGTAMEVAHQIFHHDSRYILEYLARRRTGTHGLRARELGILLGTVMMRGANQDWYEQGDVWARVAHHRRADRPCMAGDTDTSARRLMTIDVSAESTLVHGGPLADIADWISAFERAGQQLAELARRGRLERGLRAVLAHHVIFHWNRLGLTYTEQNALATLTTEVVMGTNDDGAPGLTTLGNGSNLTEVTTIGTNDMTADADHLRNLLVDQLREQGTVATEGVEAALRAVPRHVFVPASPLEEAYADQAVYTKQDDSGTSISAASQPTVVAMMLEQLLVEPGHRVLEIGAGTGYNAALLGHLVGEDGHVTTIDVDDDIVQGARAGLATAGARNVDVLLGDGALGHPDGGPYDRIIATVGAGDLPLTWFDQLAPDGLIVVPLRLRGGVSRSIAFAHEDGRWLSRSSEMCSFMPLRGIADDARRIISMRPDDSVVLHVNREQAVDEAALAEALDRPGMEAWTGVLFGGAESFEWLYLWLACTMENALSHMPVQRSAIDQRLVKPQFGWGAMAVPDQDGFAYLTLRPAEVGDGDRRHEVGVIAHGPRAAELADRVVNAIQVWNQDYRTRSVQFEIQPTETAGPIEPAPGRFAFDRPNTRLIVTLR